MQLFVGAKGFIQRPDGKVLIVREGASYIEGTELGKWDVVGGRINSDEPIIKGLKREIYEESGLEVTVGEVLGVHENFPTINGEQVHIIRIYYACTTDVDVVTLSDDHDAYEWIDPNDSDVYPIMDDVADLLKQL